MSQAQIIQFVFYALWLVGLLILLFLIWRSSEARLKHIQNMEATMFDVATKDAESSRKAVDAILTLVDSTNALVAIIRKEQGHEPE